MKKIGILLAGAFILIGSMSFAITPKESNILGSYFLQKSLTTSEIKNILTNEYNSNGKPIKICCNEVKGLATDTTCIAVRLQSVDVTKDADEVTVVVVYNIDGNVEVVNSFVSDNNKEWKSKQLKVNYLKVS